VEVNIAKPDGSTFLGAVRSAIEEISFKLKYETPNSPVRMYHLKQLMELEEILVARGAIDGGWENPDQPNYQLLDTLIQHFRRVVIIRTIRRLRRGAI